MNIGILGSGQVGQTLASGFLKHGYSVMIGTGNPGKLSDWHDQNQNARIGSFSETAQFGDVVVLAVKGTKASEALQRAGHSSLTGKTILDATNPIADAPPEGGVLKFFTSLERSLMEQLQGEVSEAHFVKAFSCIGAPFMVNADFGQEKPTMFICGNDQNSKETAERILIQFGFEVEDMGGAESARAIEPLCILWCIPGFNKNSWNHAFRLLKK